MNRRLMVPFLVLLLMVSLIPMPVALANPAYLIASYPTANRDDNFEMTDIHPSAAGISAVGQSFQNRAAATRIISVDFMLYDVGGAPDGDIIAALYAHGGVYGASSVPTGAVLATSDALPAASVNGWALHKFNFTGAQQYEMTANGYYTVFVYRTGTVGTIQVGTDSSAPAHGGNCFRYNAGAWAAEVTDDCIFYVYGGSDPTNDNLDADATFGRGQDGTATATVSDYDGVADLATVDLQVYTNTTHLGLAFDGAGDYVTAPTTGLSNAAGTLSIWFNVANYAPLNTLISMRTGGADELRVAIFNNRFYCEVGDTNTHFSTTGLNINQWHNLIVTWDSATTSTSSYMNNVLKQTAANYTVPFTVLPTIAIGARDDLSNYFTDSLDEPRILSRNITAVERAEYQDSEYSNDADLELYLSFDGNVQDGSVNSNHGTMHGNPQYTVEYSETFTLRWTQATNIFTEMADTDGVCTLSGDSLRTNVDADTDTIDYVFAIGDPAHEGPCAVKLTSTDDDALTDTTYYLAFTYSSWGGIGDTIDEAFEFFGILDYMDQMTALVTVIQVQFIASVVGIGTLITLQFQIIWSVFSWTTGWITRIFTTLIALGTAARDVLNGTYAWSTDIWTYFNFPAIIDAIPILLIVVWINDMSKRARIQGTMQVLYGDLQMFANVFAYFMGAFMVVVDIIERIVFRFFDIIT